MPSHALTGAVASISINPSTQAAIDVFLAASGLATLVA